MSNVHRAKHTSHLLHRMRRRGWSDEHIDHAEQLYAKETVHHFWLNKYSTLVHWLLVGLLGVVNATVGFIIFPLMYIFPNAGLYAVLLLLGFCFGLLYAIVLSDLWHTFASHHKFLSGALVPIIAVGSIFIMVSVFDQQIGNVYGQIRNPLATGLYYAIAFMIPYIIVMLLDIIDKSKGVIHDV